jgi:protein-tyrosine-phosphatase
MAQAIAQDILNQQEPEGITTRVESAGVAAGDGMPATQEAVDVLRSMKIELKDHQSRQLTLSMIDHAEVIYTMTPSHAQAVMTMAPNSVHKVFVLDEHEGVSDPIGQGFEVYQHTADQLKELIARRLEEIRI